MKWNKKYNYPKSSRSIIDGMRYYSIDNEKLPSCTEILELTKPEKDKEALRKWQADVGKEESQRIPNEATSRGSAMHKILENFFTNRLNGDLLEKDDLAEKMANEIIEHGIKEKFTEIYGVEATLWYPQKFSGTCDAVGIYSGAEAILDFKNSRSPKKKEWITSYLLQLALYSLAHNKVFNSNISKGVILMCSTDLTFQKFEVEGQEFIKLQEEAMKRVDLFYEMVSKR